MDLDCTRMCSCISSGSDCFGRSKHPDDKIGINVAVVETIVLHHLGGCTYTALLIKMCADKLGINFSNISKLRRAEARHHCMYATVN